MLRLSSTAAAAEVTWRAHRITRGEAQGRDNWSLTGTYANSSSHSWFALLDLGAVSRRGEQRAKRGRREGEN